MKKDKQAIIREIAQETECKMTMAKALGGPVFGPLLFFILLYSFFAYMLSTAYGYHKAKTQSEFYVVSDPGEEMVLLRAYGDKWIMSRFDRKTNQLSKGRILLLIPNIDGKTITLEDLGLMQPDPPQDRDDTSNAARVRPGDEGSGDK